MFFYVCLDCFLYCSHLLEVQLPWWFHKWSQHKTIAQYYCVESHQCCLYLWNKHDAESPSPLHIPKNGQAIKTLDAIHFSKYNLMNHWSKLIEFFTEFLEFVLSFPSSMSNYDYVMHDLMDRIENKLDFLEGLSLSLQVLHQSIANANYFWIGFLGKTFKW